MTSSIPLQIGGEVTIHLAAVVRRNVDYYNSFFAVVKWVLYKFPAIVKLYKRERRRHGEKLAIYMSGIGFFRILCYTLYYDTVQHERRKGWAA